MATTENQLFLSPLSKAAQHLSSTAISIDEVLRRPDLQPHQHNTDIQSNVHLRESRTKR